MKEYDYSRGAYYMKFILNSQTRTLFLKNWYWWTKYHFRHRRFLVLLHEVPEPPTTFLSIYSNSREMPGLFSQGRIVNDLKRR